MTKPLFASLLLLVAAAATAPAATNVWDGGVSGMWTNGGGGWGGATNWNSALPDAATFAGTGPSNVTIASDGVSVRNMLFTNSGGYVIDGPGTLTIAGSQPRWTTAVGLTNTIAARIAGTTDWSLAGGGTLILAGTSSYSGKVVVVGNAGSSGGTTLAITGNLTNTANTYFALGDGSAGVVTVSNGGSLSVLATTTREMFIGGGGATASLNVNGATIGSTNASTLFLVGSNVTLTIGGSVLLNQNGNGTLTVANGTNTILGSSATNFTLATKLGATGTINLNGGGVLETARTIQEGTNSSGSGARTSAIGFRGGTLRSLGDNTNWISDTIDSVTINSGGGAIIDTGAYTNTFNKGLLGTGDFKKVGAGNLILAGATTNFNGKINVSGGTLTFAAGFLNQANNYFIAGEAAVGTILVTNGAVVNLQGSGSLREVIVGQAITGTLNVHGGTLLAGSNVTFTVGGSQLINSGGNGTLNIDNGTNTVLGSSATNLVVANRPGSTSTINLNSGGVLETARTIQEGTNGVGARASALVFNGGTLRSLGDNTNWVGATIDTVTVTNGGGVIDTGTFTNALTKGLSGTGGLVKVGAGALILSASNTYTGAIEISNGTLVVNGRLGSNALTSVGVAGALGGTGTVSTVSIAPGGTYSWVNTGSAADRLAATALNLDGAWNVSVSGSPAPGSYTILTTSAGVTNFSAPSVLGASGSVSLAGSNLVLTISALSPFQQWQTNYFGTIANPDAAFDQDPDADGLNNLQEYAFGSVPNLAGSAILPDVGQSGNYLTITVPRNSSATDVSYEVQASTNLLTWSTVQTLSATSPAPAGSTVTYTNATPFSATPHQFLRVNVSLP